MTEKIAYSLKEACEQAGDISLSTLRRMIANNDISVKYIGSKPVILHSELVSWLETLPEEAPIK
ncbi:helix-turn-helix domain-containing protein [Arthrobacter glacialis]|uniref:helix-turn-helix domain-containing protein n=1 Tax=Arthrobacter glacialis TaxID=1664 RepID=UPI000CD4156B|nr:helix-turn-helix domain-containing protein [Arthrobacter glacialis]POH58249.1 hypothetical protein CVS28_12455 [Arthrobacter glacialis]